jgi:hypothetical protein
MEGSTLPTLIGLFVVSLTMLLLFYCLGVSRRLHKKREGYGGQPPFWRVIRRCHLYREVCAAHSDSLSTYYIVVILTWFTILLAAAILIGILWDRTHPLG